MRALIVGSIFFCQVTAASGQMIGDKRCAQPEYIAKQVDQIAEQMKRVAEAIEAVPPREADYIREEMRIALEQNNERRFELVHGHQFFYALHFHDEYKVLADNLAAARIARGKDVARYLIVSLSRISQVRAAMNDYLSFDGRRARPVVTRETRKSLYFWMPSSHAQITSLLQCVVSQL